MNRQYTYDIIQKGNEVLPGKGQTATPADDFYQPVDHQFFYTQKEIAMTDLKQLENILKQEPSLKDQHQAILKLEKKIKDQEITISVMGQFKRGKSSLINRLLGQDLLPAAIIPLTTVITEIRHGNRFIARVIYQNNSQEEIEQGEIEEFCSEEKNPGNIKQVKTLKLWTPNHPFGPGVVIADTPGVGSINQHNTDSSYQYIMQSDVILFLLSVDSPVSETERDFLLSSRDFAQKFFFAVNKSDMVDEKDLAKFTQYCSHTISDYLDASITIMPTSAKTGQGTDKLKDLLQNQLKTHHSELLQKSVQHKVQIIKSQAAGKLKLYITAASTPAHQVKQQLDHVEAKEKQITTFADQLQVISKHHAERLIEEIEISMKDQCLKINKELQDQGNILFNENYNTKSKDFEKLLGSTMRQELILRLNRLNSQGLSQLETGYALISKELQDKAMETATFISNILKDEFQIEYPVTESTFHLSKKSDFIMHTGFENKIMPDINTFSHLLPKKIANHRYFKRVMEQTEIDIERNCNNMLYNYRYKMQESLRTLCLNLTEETSKMEAELDMIKGHVRDTLDMAEQTKEAEICRLTELLQAIESN